MCEASDHHLEALHEILPTDMFCLAYTKVFFFFSKKELNHLPTFKHLEIYIIIPISSSSWKWEGLASWPTSLHGTQDTVTVTSLFRGHDGQSAPMSTHLGHLPGSWRHLYVQPPVLTIPNSSDPQNPLLTFPCVHCCTQ